MHSDNKANLKATAYCKNNKKVRCLLIAIILKLRKVVLELDKKENSLTSSSRLLLPVPRVSFRQNFVVNGNEFPGDLKKVRYWQDFVVSVFFLQAGCFAEAAEKIQEI